MIILIENMKYKKISVVLPGPLSGACRQGKEECRQEAGRNQAGGRKQAGGRQEQTTADECVVEVGDGMGVVGREGGHSGPALYHPGWFF